MSQRRNAPLFGGALFVAGIAAPGLAGVTFEPNASGLNSGWTASAFVSSFSGYAYGGPTYGGDASAVLLAPTATSIDATDYELGWGGSVIVSTDGVSMTATTAVGTGGYFLYSYSDAFAYFSVDVDHWIEFSWAFENGARPRALLRDWTDGGVAELSIGNVGDPRPDETGAQQFLLEAGRRYSLEMHADIVNATHTAVAFDAVFRPVPSPSVPAVLAVSAVAFARRRWA